MRHTPNSEQVTSAKGGPTRSDVGIVSNFFHRERGGQLQGMLRCLYSSRAIEDFGTSVPRQSEGSQNQGQQGSQGVP